MSPLKLRPTNQALDRDEAWRDVRHERSRGYICHPYWLIGSRNLGAKRPYLALCLGPATALSLSTNLVTKVRVDEPSASRRTITGFQSMAEAENWIEIQKRHEPRVGLGPQPRGS